MDDRLTRFFEYTKDRIGIVNHRLHRYMILREKNVLNGTDYFLSMEWFPNDIDPSKIDEDCNPLGTIVVDLDIHELKFRRVIFVGGKSESKYFKVDPKDLEAITHWVEEETGLVYPDQFKLFKKEEKEVGLQACFRGMPVFPAGYINVEIDDAGNILLFSHSGFFPTNDLVKEEEYNLTIDKAMNVYAKDQLKRVEFPSRKQKKWLSIYVMEEVFVTNDGKQRIPYEISLGSGSRLQMDQILEWDTPLHEKFQKRERNLWEEEVTIEQALSGEPHPDLKLLSDEEQEEAITATIDFMRKEYPKDSGAWQLILLFREKGYLNAVLKPVDHLKVIPRKIWVMIKPENFEVVHFMDNQGLLENVKHYPASGEIKISQGEAYEIIKEKIHLTPVYVYSQEEKKYVLCGKLDCEYGVLADCGKIIALNEM